MPKLITVLLIVFMGGFLLTSIVEFYKTRSVRRLVIQLASIVGVALVLNLTVGFPRPVQTFGGVSPLIAVGIMLIFVSLGIVGRYVASKEKPAGLSIAQALFISPIVLLPLIGSIQTNSNLEPIQMISIAIIAYQNGFFWTENMKAIVKAMKKVTADRK